MQNEEHIAQLEADIRASQEAALDAAESDSILTGTSLNPDDSSVLGEWWARSILGRHSGSLCVCVCVCLHMRVGVYVGVCTCVWECMWVSAHVCVHMHTYVCM